MSHFVRLSHVLLLELVRQVLRNPFEFEWSYQGLGMLRLYLGEAGRLHIWHPGLAVPDASPIHNHSWSLRSVVISGQITNTRFQEAWPIPDGVEQNYWHQRLICGYNSDTVGPPMPIYLRRFRDEVYPPGSSYAQRAEELHQTRALPGTVTLIEREFDGDDKEADVYFEVGKTFVSAKPRPATREEVELFTEAAKTLMINSRNLL